MLGCLLRCLYVTRVDVCGFFFFQAEDGIRDLVRSRGLGDVYKRQGLGLATQEFGARFFGNGARPGVVLKHPGSLSDRALSLIHI